MNIEAQKGYALSLLETSAYCHETRQFIEEWLLEEKHPEVLQKAIEKLKDNQLDRVSSGLFCNNTHIRNHIRKILRDEPKTTE